MESKESCPGTGGPGQPKLTKKTSDGPTANKKNSTYQILISHQKSDGTIKEKILNVELFKPDKNSKGEVEIILQKELVNNNTMIPANFAFEIKSTEKILSKLEVCGIRSGRKIRTNSDED